MVPRTSSAASRLRSLEVMKASMMRTSQTLNRSMVMLGPQVEPGRLGVEAVAPAHEAQEAQDCRAEQDVERVGQVPHAGSLATCPAEADGYHGGWHGTDSRRKDAARERSPSGL